MNSESASTDDGMRCEDADGYEKEKITGSCGG